MKNRLLKETIYFFAALSLMALCWFFAYKSAKNSLLVPSFSETFEAALREFSSLEFYLSLFNTLLRTIFSFALSLLAAAIFAVLSFLLFPARNILNAVISIIRVIPTMAVTLILLVWTSPKIAPCIITALVSFPMLYSLFLSALDGVGKRFGDLSKVYGFSLKDKIFKIYIPLSAPVVLGGLGAQFSLALKIMVSAEVLSYTFHSVGGLMSEAKMYLEMPTLFSLMIIVIAVGLLSEGFFAIIKKAAVRWRE